MIVHNYDSNLLNDSIWIFLSQILLFEDFVRTYRYWFLKNFSSIVRTERTLNIWILPYVRRPLYEESIIVAFRILFFEWKNIINIRTYIWKHMYVRTIFPYVWFKLSNKQMFIIYCTCLFLSNLISLRVCLINMIRITYVLKLMYVRIIFYCLIHVVTNQYVYNLKLVYGLFANRRSVDTSATTSTKIWKRSQ